MQRIGFEPVELDGPRLAATVVWREIARGLEAVTVIVSGDEVGRVDLSQIDMKVDGRVSLEARPLRRVAVGL